MTAVERRKAIDKKTADEVKRVAILDELRALGRKKRSASITAQDALGAIRSAAEKADRLGIPMTEIAAAAGVSYEVLRRTVR
jgi:DNA-binding transcriptional ArsR family regulator